MADSGHFQTQQNEAKELLQRWCDPPSILKALQQGLLLRTLKAAQHGRMEYYGNPAK